MLNSHDCNFLMKFVKYDYDEKANTCKIRLKSSLFAVKDQDSKEWSFVNMKEQDSLMNKLFSKDVLDKLATYQ